MVSFAFYKTPSKEILRLSRPCLPDTALMGAQIRYSLGGHSREHLSKPLSQSEAKCDATDMKMSCAISLV